MKQIPYQRSNATAYAKKWAFGRNPAYYDFEKIGGDCTNFVSQCIYAGSQIMNPAKVFGWYYYSSSNRTASWTGVPYLYQFLTKNEGVGPYGKEMGASSMELGDIVQLGNANGDYYHSPIVVGITNQEIYLAAHSYDAYMRPLNSYVFDRVRYIHILGVRSY